jgi:NitT/TauT family transport system ATP-binding protein
MTDTRRMNSGAGVGTTRFGGEPSVRVTRLMKDYPGGIRALEDISFDMPKGELTTIIGPSGCGKTTTLKIIAGLVEATSGEVIIDGSRVRGPGPERAFVFQDFALMPWASVLRNVAFGLELRGVGKKERDSIARDYIAKMNLKGFEDAYPHQLSGGMRQRVGLARAMAVEADILLMDEPFASVDEQIRRKFQEDLLRLLGEEKKSAIFVTHSIEEAVYLSDQIVILTPAPAHVSKVVRPGIDHTGESQNIRRSSAYLDCVESIWAELRNYLEE